MTQTQFKLDTTDFEEAWRMYSERAMGEYSPMHMAHFRHLFMSGGAMAVGVLSNRLSNLPGTVEPGDMVKALVDTIAESIAELELKTDSTMKGNA